MKKDVLIGAVDLYGWDKISTWIKSIRATGYADDIVLLTYRLNNPDHVIAECKKYNVDVFEISHDSFGFPINHNDRGRDTQAHQMRFFHIWQFLKDSHDSFRNVLITDVRDVVFQSNPFLMLQTTDKIVASSEGMLYKNEWWGTENMQNGFGPLVWEYAKDWTIYNVGVLGGPAKKIEHLSFIIYNMTLGRYIPCDQSIFNALVNDVMPDSFIRWGHETPYACQCALSMEPSRAHLRSFFKEPMPVIKDGIAYTADGSMFSIVHQYDRVPGFNEAVIARFA